MDTKLLDLVESKSLKDKVPYFEIGDTVDVHCKITEGVKSRVQIFTGTVIARKGRGINETFIVRRFSGDEISVIMNGRPSVVIPRFLVFTRGELSPA